MGQFTTAQETALTEEYLQASLARETDPDFALVIAGWPIIYVCHKGDYSIPSSGGTLNAANGFTTIRKWMNPPSGYTSEIKGVHPEGGKHDIGVMDCDLLDINADGYRELSDLVSRQAYLEGTSSGTITELAGAISKTDTTITLDDSTGFVEGSLLYLSQECILLGSKVTNTFSNCTRGYLLTNAEPHEDGIKAYSFKPAVYRSPAYIFKGFQGITLDKWIKAFGGVIVNEPKAAGVVTFSIRASTWELHGNGTKNLVRMAEVGKSVGVRGGLYSGEYAATLTIDTTRSGASLATLLSDGHWAFECEGQWYGIVSATYVSDTPDGSRFLDAKIVKGMSGNMPEDRISDDPEEPAPATLAWTNCDYTVFDNPNPLTTRPLTGSDPITLMLQLLLSRNGDGLNHATYDVFPKGTGLGIPAGLVDVTSFTDVQAEYDYDDNMRCFFLLKERTEAKKFIEEELCKPFGWYIYTRNDGRISLKRPKNPVKFHTSRGNDDFAVRVPTATGTLYTAKLSSGVRTGAEVATALQAALTAALGTSGYTATVTYASNLFDVIITGANWDVVDTSGDDGWATIGIAAQTNIVSGDRAARSSVGVFTETSFNTLTENELSDIEIVDNREAQVSQVIYRANYSWIDDDYKLTKIYEDAESRNIFGSAGAIEKELKSKGLLILRTSTGGKKIIRGPWSVFRHPNSGSGTCNPQRVDVDLSYGLDADNSWASLLAAIFFDRYRFNPPLMFKARIPWRFSVREPGDCLQVSYAIDGVVTDRELNVTVLSTRIFEIVSIKPVFADGQCEVTLLGHRSAT